MKRTPAILAVASLAIAAIGAGALARIAATGIVKERMNQMGFIGDAMKNLNAMMTGTTAYDPEQVETLARNIGVQGGDALTDLFPDGSLDHPSEALPAIWEELTAYANALAAATGNERTAGEPADIMGSDDMMSGEPVRPSPEEAAGMSPDAAFQQLAETCTACHQDFREKK